MGCQPDQPGRSDHLAAVLVEIVGENGLGDLLGQAEIKSVDASAGRQIHRPEHLASGVDLDSSLSAPGVEETIDESQRLEDLERAGMHYCRPVPMERRWSGIDQMTWDTAAMKLRSEEQPRWPGTDHERGWTVAYPTGVAVLRHRDRTVVGIRHYFPLPFVPERTSLALVGDSSVWVIKPPTEYFEFGGAGQAASERLSPVVFPVRKMWSLRSGVCGELVFTQLWAVDKDHSNVISTGIG